MLGKSKHLNTEQKRYEVMNTSSSGRKLSANGSSRSRRGTAGPEKVVGKMTSQRLRAQQHLSGKTHTS
jgi:hypothetical protein